MLISGLKMRLILLFVLLIFSQIVSGQKISEYKIVSGWGVILSSDEKVILLRNYSLENSRYFLVIDPQTLKTIRVKADSLTIKLVPADSIRFMFTGSAYLRALRDAGQNSVPLQDAGIRRFNGNQKGIDLTIDLCPSARPLDRVVFTELISEVGKTEKPVPLAVSVTGRWLESHPGDFRWLDSLVTAGDLSIEWINHSYHHRTSREIPLARNFMLMPGTDVNSEILNTETAMLERNILPSVFFRFPGLVSDQAVYNKVLALGLIPVGCDAWLAKGEWPSNGSIVLIHANGNEPVGVREFIRLLKIRHPDILSKQWELYDLRESLVEQESPVQIK